MCVCGRLGAPQPRTSLLSKITSAASQPRAPDGLDSQPQPPHGPHRRTRRAGKTSVNPRKWRKSSRSSSEVLSEADCVALGAPCQHAARNAHTRKRERGRDALNWTEDMAGSKG